MMSFGNNKFGSLLFVFVDMGGLICRLVLAKECEPYWPHISWSKIELSHFAIQLTDYKIFYKTILRLKTR